MSMNAHLDVNRLIAQMNNDPAVLAAALILLLVILVFVVLFIVGRWKTVSKLGGRGWSQIIPVYTDWELSTSAGCDRALCIALTVLSAINVLGYVVKDETFQGISGLCALASLVVGIMVNYKVACRFGKGKGFTFGLVVLAPIFYAILGLGSAMPVDADEA